MPFGNPVTTLVTRPQRAEVQQFIDSLLDSYGLDRNSPDIKSYRAQAPQRVANGNLSRDDIARDLDPAYGVVTTLQRSLYVTTLATAALWPRTIVLAHLGSLSRLNRITVDGDGMHLWEDTIFDSHCLATVQRGAITPGSTAWQYRQRCWELAQFTGTNFDWRRLVGRDSFEVAQQSDSWQLTRHLALVEAH